MSRLVDCYQTFSHSLKYPKTPIAKLIKITTTMYSNTHHTHLFFVIGDLRFFITNFSIITVPQKIKNSCI